MKVLFVGGSGEISLACVIQAVKHGHNVFVLNRGRNNYKLPGTVTCLQGDLTSDAPYQCLEGLTFDVVCQFYVFTPAQMTRDIAFFKEKCEQYIFVSTASAYDTADRNKPIVESLPLKNTHWPYSQAKAHCETLLIRSPLHSTIVRPSHTYRTRLPSTVVDSDHLAWRICHNKPILVHDSAKTLWTVTHADDFASAFVTLLGNTRALGESFHITSEESHSWEHILRKVAFALSREARLCRIDSEELIDRIPSLQGPLRGDKANAAIFDNSKIRHFAGDWKCNVSIDDGFARAASVTLDRLSSGYQPDVDYDRVIDELTQEASLAS